MARASVPFFARRILMRPDNGGLDQDALEVRILAAGIGEASRDDFHHIGDFTVRRN